MYTQLSNYVDDVESRNMEYFPDRYDAFLQDNLSRVRGDMDVDIQGVNIQDFMDEPN